MQLKTDHKILFFILIGFFSIVLFECDLTPAEPDLENPTDSTEWGEEGPDNPPSFTSLWAEIDGVDLFTDSLLVTFRGNLDTMEFRSKIDDDPWPGWATDTLKIFRYLDEGPHTIGIQTRYVGVNSAIADTSFSFIVDAVQGNSLMFSPRMQQVSVNSSFNVEVMLEEVTDIMTLHTEILFDHTKFQLEEITVDTLSNFMLSNSGQLVKIIDISQEGKIELDVGLAQADPAGVSGTGVVAFLTFKAIVTGTHSLVFGNACRMIDSQLGEIAINETTVAWVEVE